MRATHIDISGLDTARKVANRALKAMADICEYDNGTISNPVELASATPYRQRGDNRSLIRIIADGQTVMYNDGWYIVECDGQCLYVDITGFACREELKQGRTSYEIYDDTLDEDEIAARKASDEILGKNLYRVSIEDMFRN